METEGRLRVADIFVGIRDLRQAKKVEHDLVELLGLKVRRHIAATSDSYRAELLGLV